MHEAQGGDGFDDAVHHLTGRLAALEERQRYAEEATAAAARQRLDLPVGLPYGLNVEGIQAEFERLRKLFEFVEGVLPKDAREAMQFFNNSRAASEEGPPEDLERPLGPGVQLERHRARLEEGVKKHKEEMQHEFQNLNSVIKSLQRQLGICNSKIDELSSRLTQIEAQPPMESRGLERAMEKGTPCAACSSSARPSPQQSAEQPMDVHHLMDPEGIGDHALPFVSKMNLQQAVEGLRDDVRNWLDVLHSSMISALQQKADTDDLNLVRGQLSNAESLAMFAKRSIVGKCASCDTPFDVDPSKINRPIAVAGRQEKWSAQGAPGAKVSIRARDGKPVQIVGGYSNTRLPKIQEPRVSKDFPKGRVLSTSQPDLRKVPSDTTAVTG